MLPPSSSLRSRLTRTLMLLGLTTLGALALADSAGAVQSAIPVDPSPPNTILAGDYYYDSANGSNFYKTWNDGCILINSTSQQDVYFDTIPLVQGTPPTDTPTSISTTTATSTSTWTPSATPTATPSNSCSSYVITSTPGATIMPGTVDTGNHCDNCLTTIGLPFPVTLYGTQYTSARVSSNGNLQFSQNSYSVYGCLPFAPPYTYYATIFPYLDDLSTLGAGGDAGIFTAVSGSAPNRTFEIEWRACIQTPGPCSAVDTNFEVRLHEGDSSFEIIYGAMLQNGGGATVGVQRDILAYTQFSCNSASLLPGMKLTFSATGGTCPATPTIRPTPSTTSHPWPNLTGQISWATTCTPFSFRLTTLCDVCHIFPVGPTHMRVENNAGNYLDIPVPSLGVPYYTYVCPVGTCVPNSWLASPPYRLTVDIFHAVSEPFEWDNTSMLSTVPLCATNTPTASPTNTMTRTSTPTASMTPCMVNFSDVPEESTFYTHIRCLACRGIISGYAEGTFRPGNDVTRGQLSKIVAGAAGFTESPDPQMFEDVPPSNTFYQWINRLARRGHMSGYPCGGPGEPCTNNMPYFRPFANATRGQTSKIVSNAAGYSEVPVDQTFEDVPPAHTFYREIQRLASRNIMGGYPCGGAGEPCISGKPYFRPQNNVTRGQSAKIVANTFFPSCQTP